MFAVIKTGGKQYKVKQGDILKVEKLSHDEGDAFSFDQVLMIAGDDGVTIGQPTVDGATVEASVSSHGRAKKIKVLKFKRRKHHMKQMGHRQSYTEVIIGKINAS